MTAYSFVFKQKAAYEMRISDWSSDVCSSDLANGFLCITGYSERTGELIIASKSRVDGTFAEWAQALVAEKLGPAGMERLMRFNRDQKASLVFEAIDMTNDPHIIDYAENKLVLLGCVRRHETRSEEHTSELQSLMRNSLAVFCFK